MNQRLNIGLAIKILSDAITFSSLNEVDGDQFYESNKKKISRMAELDLSKMTNNDFDILIDFSKRIDRWAEWSKEKGYLTGFQQTAISDFFMILFEATQLNPPLTKEMAEHFFCYALAKVLYFQIQNRRKTIQMKPNMRQCIGLFHYSIFLVMMKIIKKILHLLQVHFLY